MNKKTFITLLVIFLFIMSISTLSFATNSTMSNAKNTVMNAGNAIGDAAMGTKNTVVSGARDLGNGATSLANSAINGIQGMTDDTENMMGTTLDNTDNDYTATRTAAGNNNFLGMSDNTWTWLILGIVSIAIISLVWYYSAQYEHRKYNND